MYMCDVSAPRNMRKYTRVCARGTILRLSRPDKWVADSKCHIGDDKLRNTNLKKVQTVM